MREMRKSGSFSPYGEFIAKTVNQYLEGYDSINMNGYSMGARVGLAAAPMLNTEASFLSLTDPPGSRRLGLIGIATALSIEERSNAKKYTEHSDNHLALALQKESDKDAVKKHTSHGL